MVNIVNKSITLDQFLELPETKPASEYFDGQVSQKPMPQGQHSIIQSELVSALNVAMRRQGIAIAFTELRCTFAARSIVPDIAVFESARIPRTVGGEIANTFDLSPDWVIEVLSPGQSSTKVLRKIIFCLKQGTQMGWLIDPEERVILICRDGQELIAIDAEDAAARLLMPGFAAEVQLTFEDIFGWLI